MNSKFNKLAVAITSAVVLFCTLPMVSQAQVTVANSTGANGTYTTLKLAFDALNAQGTQAGNNITVSITGNTTETASAVLNQPTTSSWTSLTISPSGGAARTISGAIPAGSPLIDLNGADNVTINGLNTGGNALTIVNTSTSNTAGTSTIRFINDASSNTLTNCSINGATTATGMGVIVFGAGTVTGNDNNNINNCNIADASGTFPLNSIVSTGTSAAIDNSNNILNANNISNYFSAGSASSGILLTATGNSTWTITNNKLFQTATRTYTAGNTHNGISVQTGNGYVITGNTIGYANNSNGGTYTMAGTIATRFIAINLAVGTTTATSVQNNTITAISLTTSSGATTVNGILCGINVTAGNVNIGTVTGNTIGATTGTGSIITTTSTSGGLTVGINDASPDVVNIVNNNIGSITANGSGGTIAASITGIQVTAGTPTITGNTIGSTTANSIQSPTVGTLNQLVNGINITSTVTANTNISNNTVNNLTQLGTGTNAVARGIVYSGTGFPTIIGNIVSNISAASANATVAGGATAVLGILCTGNAVTGANVSQNTIFNIAATNTGAVQTNAVGIGYSNPSNGTVTRNRIYNISNASTLTTATAPPTASGILIRAAQGSGGTVANNMISLGDAQTTNTAFIGIWHNFLTARINIYHNSVNISGTATSGALPSACFHRGTFVATISTPIDIKNNIFANTRSGGTGKHYAIANGIGVTATATGWAADASYANVLNANAATVGFWTSDQTIAAWQTSSAGDGNSQSGVTINYINTTTADLHINTGIATTIEGAGVTLAAITEDFDGQTRTGLTPIDIGADAGNFMVATDIYAPSITYTPLTNACNAAGARTLTATITDASGVPTSGAGLPVLYWRINAGAYTAATATHAGGSTYTFSLGTGSVANDVISYYIVAQDLAGTPNIGTFPSTGASGFTLSPPAASTAPTTQSSYTNAIGLTGTYTVGVGQTYTTLTAAITAYNTSCLSGAVVFSLIDANYAGETFPITINANGNASAVNTLTIKPTQANTTITGSSASALLVLDGADYVILDGSIGSTVNSICPLTTASRDLTLTNTNTGTSSAVVWLQTTAGTDAVTNNIVRNCNLVGSGVTQTLFGVGSGSTTISTTSLGTSNNNNAFVNNNISAVQYGIYSQGAAIAAKNTGNIINQNSINTSANTKGGILVGFENNISISGNTISNIAQATSPDVFAINCGFGTSYSSTTSIGNEVTNATITNNNIGNVVNSGTFSAMGIGVSAATSGTTLIANNTISGVMSNGTGGDFAGGIVLGGGTGSTTNVYYNTVVMQGTITGGSAATQASACLAITNSTEPTVDIRNNNFVNTQIGNASATLKFATIAVQYTPFTAATTSNNNNLFCAGAGPGTYQIGMTGGIVTGTARTLLTDWRTFTGKDVVSLNVSPVFVSATDLHLVATNPVNAPLAIGGMPASVTTDIDCTTRSATTPSIGADEFVPPPTITNFTPTSGGVDAVVTITGTNFTGASAVTIGGVAARSYTVVNATTITAVVGDNFTTGLVQVTQGTTATSAALGTPNFTRTSCPNTIAALVATPSNDANGFAGFDLTWTNGGTYTAVNVFYQPVSGAGSSFYTRRTFAGTATSGRIWTVNSTSLAYNIYVQGVCTGNAERVSTTANTGLTGNSCSIITLAPTPLTVNNTDITFTWNTVPNAYLYQPIYQECDVNGLRVAGGGQTGTAYLTPNTHPSTQSWTVSQLKPNTFYRFSVRVHCLQGNSNLISPYSLYPFIQTGSSGTTCAAPAPTLGTAGEINGYASQVINWAAVPSATNGYGIFFRENSQPDWTTYHLGNVLTYTISGLKQGATYTYFVYGACSNGQAPRSAELTFTAGTATLDCNASTLNASVGVSTNPIGATLSWTTTPNAVQAGKLYGIVYNAVSTPGTTYVVYTDNVSQTLSQTTHQGIVANTNYVYRLQTFCDGRLQWVNNSGTFNVPLPSGAEKNSPETITPQGLQALAGFGELEVYPNPTDSKLSIELGLDKSAKVGIKLTDAAGRMVFNETVSANGLNFRHDIDMKNLASGVYLLMVNVEGKTTVKKIVKQ